MGVDEVRPAVILDRDGTLIDFVRDEETGAIVSAFHPSQIRLLPGVVEGLRFLRDAGYMLAVATNQPGAAKGQCSAEAIAATNVAVRSAIAEALSLAEPMPWWTCSHHPTGGPGGDAHLIMDCECRKPKPGLVDGLVYLFDIDLAASWMVGDTYVDVECGRAAGMRTALLMARGRCEFCPLQGKAPPDATGETLVEVAARILAAR